MWKHLIIYSFTVLTRVHFGTEEFESYWITIAKNQRKLELKTILVGVTDTKCFLCLTTSIVLGKLY